MKTTNNQLTITTAPIRYFQIGAMKIKDELSDLPFEKAFQYLAKQYPQMRHTQVFEDDAIVQNDGTLLYNVPLMKVATNG